MKKVIKMKAIGMFVFILLVNSMLGQKTQFSGDSLVGFQEDAAKKATLSEGYYGSEFAYHMNQLKREYVNAKYGIKTNLVSFHKIRSNNHFQQLSKASAAPACNNEDFEGSAAGLISTSNQITGWTVDGGTNNNGSNSCNLLGCCPNPPSNSELITAGATGYLDPVIGGTYPIYSVFGTAPNNGLPSNPQLGLSAMKGTNFLRLNDAVTGDWSMERLSKTFAVTANNSLFQFAFISVFSTGHTCCSAGSFQIKLTNATTNSVLSCPAFSVSAPSSQCTSTNPLSYFVAGSGVPYNGSNGSLIFNKWKLNTLDLTAYINQNITIDIIATDCDAGGHYGYVYFDAQCSPMAIIGNSTSFPAGTQSITLPTCGANGATITLPTGLGPYSWQGPGVPGNYTVPSFTNQTYVTAISGTLVAIMNPAGSCAPILRNITVSVTPAPNLVITALQPTCSNSVATLTGTLTVGATPMTVVTTGPTGTVITNVSTNVLSAPGGTVTTLVAGVHTVQVQDFIGCNITKTVLINPPLAIPNFSVGSPSNDYTLTCLNTPITMTSSAGTSLNYVWSHASGTLTGAVQNLTQPGNWQVVGQNPVSGCSVAVNFILYSNLSSPTVVLTPTVVNVTCSLAASCFTGTCNQGPNVTTNWYQVAGTNTIYVGVAQGTINIFCPGAPGAYWFEAKNNLTGCVTTKSAQVTASVGVPIFTVTSPNNFTVGCSTKSISSMQVSTVVTSPTLNVSCNFAFVPPPGTVTPSYSNNPNVVTTGTPGTWVVYVRDQTNNCVSSQSITIIQNITPPNIDFIQPLSILSCREPSMVLSGISSNTNTTITWTVPAPPSSSVFPAPNVTVTILPTVSNATNNITTIGVYTVGAVDNNNLCTSRKTIQINQDVRLPVFSLSAATNSIINCINTDVLIVPVVSNTLAAALVPTFMWYPPVGPGLPGTSFNTTAANLHTAVATSAANGCTYTATYNVASDLTAPAVDQTNKTFTLDCGSNQATITVIVTPSTNLTYNWNIYPFGASVTTTTRSVLAGNKPGEYGVVVTNTLNGCKTTADYDVVEGTLNVDFTPSTDFGYAPQLVSFQNNSSSSFSTGILIANWSYGNGTILTNTYTNGSSSILPATTYTAPGTYSVMLTGTKGTCSGTKVRIITIEVPSKLEIPNVFTPNGDKVNDIFRLIASSLDEIQASIFDRWGNKVYEVNSNTGNIAWDGKNLSGQACAEGTYFYIIKAKGKDGQEYDLKGNVSLFK